MGVLGVLELAVLAQPPVVVALPVVAAQNASRRVPDQGRCGVLDWRLLAALRHPLTRRRLLLASLACAFPDSRANSPAATCSGVHLLLRRLGARGIHDSWETIRRKLANWMRLTTTLVTAGGERIECRQDSRPDQEAAALARAAGVQPQLHRVRTRTPMD